MDYRFRGNDGMGIEGARGRVDSIRVVARASRTSSSGARSASRGIACDNRCMPYDIGPRRIVCLTEEPTEVLYALGEQERIVGISGFTVRPPRARKEKPKVSAFTSAKIGEILALEPDFVIGFSDIQAEIARELIAAGVEVWISNHRSVAGILDYIRRLGALVGVPRRAEEYVHQVMMHLDSIERAAVALPKRPLVYFEEWDEPLITGIRWVAELVRIAGGDDVFPERSAMPLARDRIIADPGEVVREAPDIIFGSWCGKKFRRDRVAARPGWSAIPAVRDGELHEIKSPIILQPGPAALLDGITALHTVIARWSHAYAERAARGPSRKRRS